MTLEDSENKDTVISAWVLISDTVTDIHWKLGHMKHTKTLNKNTSPLTDSVRFLVGPLGLFMR